MAILVASQLSAITLAFTPVKGRVASLRLEGQILSVVCAYGPNSQIRFQSGLPFVSSSVHNIYGRNF